MGAGASTSWSRASKMGYLREVSRPVSTDGGTGPLAPPDTPLLEYQDLRRKVIDPLYQSSSGGETDSWVQTAGGHARSLRLRPKR